MAIKWYGPKVTRQLERATMRGMNTTMSQAAVHAKRNHPGWRNITGKAEGSIIVVKMAHKTARGFVGLWGSRNVLYMLWLELKHGSALRHAAGVIYPRLPGYIKANMP